MVTKLSKVKNVFGETHKLYFEDVKPAEITTDGQLLDINSHFAAISWASSGGGSVCVLDSMNPHRISTSAYMIRGHSAPIVDVKWSPYKSNILATASDDATIKLWDIPKEGLTEDIKTETQTLSGHLKKVAIINWHPSVFEIIASGGFDNKVNVWNVLTGDSLHSFNFHESLMSLEWNDIGSLLALSTKDKLIHIVDPRQNKVDVSFKAFDSAKNTKVCWVSQDHIITTGYGKSNDRQIRLWDIKNTSKEYKYLLHRVQTVSIDTQSGPISPYFDADTGIIYCPGRGEGNIKYFEFNSGSVKVLNDFRSGTSQKSVCFFPKRSMNYNKCEVARMGKLTANSLEYVSFYVPKRVEGFVSELYPDCVSGEISTTVEEWKAGSIKGPTRKPINTLDNKWKTSDSTFEVQKSEPVVATHNENLDVNALKESNHQLQKQVAELKLQVEELTAKVKYIFKIEQRIIEPTRTPLINK